MCRMPPRPAPDPGEAPAPRRRFDALHVRDPGRVFLGPIDSIVRALTTPALRWTSSQITRVLIDESLTARRAACDTEGRHIGPTRGGACGHCGQPLTDPEA